MRSLQFATSYDCFNALYSAYSEKHRFYHTTKHIDAMLQHFDSIKTLAERPEELELGIWFHDAIYKPLSKNNEQVSAQWAQEFCISNSYDSSGAERVYDLIMATLHDGEVNSIDKMLIVDIDLTILGTSPEVYDEFEMNVRMEYKMVPSFIYRSKRKAILNSFFGRSSIFQTEYFQSRYEDSAKENIARAISAL
jgi:predicted metal-dependent HD superfamily phosphohydrolase